MKAINLIIILVLFLFILCGNNTKITLQLQETSIIDTVDAVINSKKNSKSELADISNKTFQRRKDLIDPLPYLEEMINNSKINTMDKPYYIIDFNAVNCLIDIRVNDVSAFCMNIDGQVSTIVPVNNAVLESGQQQATYNIWPLLGETALRSNAKFSAAVWLYDASGDLIEKVKEISNFTMPENKTGIPLPAYKGEDYFYAEVPYKLDAWQNSKNLKEIDNLRALVDATYKKIEAMINNAQYDQFADLIQKRENNIATCMYLSEAEKKSRITELIEKISTGYKIVPVSEKDMMIFYGYNKLVSLRKLNGDSALLLINPETGAELSLEILFHLKQGETELSVI